MDQKFSQELSLAELSNNARMNALLVFEDWGCKVLDQDAFFAAIETDALLVKELNSYPEMSGPGDWGLDTYDREWMMGHVTEEIIGVDWPCYGDSQSVHNNFSSLMKACEVFECESW